MVKVKVNKKPQAVDSSTVAYNDRMETPNILCLCENQHPIHKVKKFNDNRSDVHRHQKLSKCDDRRCLLVFVANQVHIHARDALGLDEVDDNSDAEDAAEVEAAEVEAAEEEDAEEDASEEEDAAVAGLVEAAEVEAAEVEAAEVEAAEEAAAVAGLVEDAAFAGLVVAGTE